MRCLVCTLMILTAMALAVPAGGLQAGGGETATWIRALGSPRYQDREAAMRALEKLGEAALPGLREVLGAGDLEARSRAGILVQRIETRLAIARAMHGKRVHLQFKNTPVLEAIKIVGEQAGCSFAVDDVNDDLQDRTITLDTGAVTFWEAFDRFCQKAGLSEGNPVSEVESAPDGQQHLPLFRVLSAREQALGGDAAVRTTATDYRGSLRIRAIRAESKTRLPGEAASVGFLLDVCPQPGVNWQGVSRVRIDGAVDEHGQALRTIPVAAEGPNADPLLGAPAIRVDGISGQAVHQRERRHLVLVSFVGADRAPALAKKIEGTIAFDFFVLREMLTIKNVMSASGVRHETAEAGSIMVQEVERQGRVLRIRIREQADRQALAAGQGARLMRTRDGALYVRDADPNASHRFVLEPEGQNAPLLPSSATQTLVPSEPRKGEGKGGRDGPVRLETLWTLTFSLPADCPDSIALVCKTPRQATAEVPFSLQEVPLSATPRQPTPFQETVPVVGK